MVAQNKVNSCLTGFLVCVNVIFMLFGLGLMTAGIYLHHLSYLQGLGSALNLITLYYKKPDWAILRRPCVNK